MALGLHLGVSWTLGHLSGRYCSENKMEPFRNPDALVLSPERLRQAARSLWPPARAACRFAQCFDEWRESSSLVFWKILSPFFTLLMFSILPA